MAILGRRLEAAGFRVVNVGYDSRAHPLEVLVEDLRGTLRTCCGGPRRVHFVTHSMGGILVRALLAEHGEGYRGRVVMLSPPTRGSEVIDAFQESELAHRFLGPAGMSLGTDSSSTPNRLPAPDYPIGVITGDRSINPINSWLIPGPDDGKVAVERAGVPRAPLLVVHRTHPFIMNGEDVGEAVVEFLRTGTFGARPVEVPVAGPEGVVRALLQAFNDHDVPGMGALVTDSVTWYGVSRGSLSVEARGRDALLAGMGEYFRALPSARSELLGIEALGPWVTTREMARWTAASESRAQASVAVYEVQDGRVATVWYFPAVPCASATTDPPACAVP